MTFKIKAASLLPGLAGLAIAAGACSGESSGQPLPVPTLTSETSKPPSSGSNGDNRSLDSLDPCTLLTAQEIKQLDADEGVPKKTSGARACQWLVPGGRGVFSVNLRSGQGLSDIVLGRGRLSDQRVGSHDGKLLTEDFGTGTCMEAYAKANLKK